MLPKKKKQKRVNELIPAQLQIEERTIQNRKAICVENKLEMLQQNLSIPFQNNKLKILQQNMNIPYQNKILSI